MISSNIIPKDCVYKCNTRIYWNNEENAYFEAFSGNKRQCSNRLNNNKKSITPSTNNKPTYYNKFAKQHFTKPKMSNSLELLSGPIADIQKKYEILSDIVTEYNGKVHGSQSHIIGLGNSTSLIVYFEVPEGKREEVKRSLRTLLEIIR